MSLREGQAHTHCQKPRMTNPNPSSLRGSKTLQSLLWVPPPHSLDHLVPPHTEAPPHTKAPPRHAPPNFRTPPPGPGRSAQAPTGRGGDRPAHMGTSAAMTGCVRGTGAGSGCGPVWVSAVGDAKNWAHGVRRPRRVPGPVCSQLGCPVAGPRLGPGPGAAAAGASGHARARRPGKRHVHGGPLLCSERVSVAGALRPRSCGRGLVRGPDGGPGAPVSAARCWPAHGGATGTHSPEGGCRPVPRAEATGEDEDPEVR